MKIKIYLWVGVVYLFRRFPEFPIFPAVSSSHHFSFISSHAQIHHVYGELSKIGLGIWKMFTDSTESEVSLLSLDISIYIFKFKKLVVLPPTQN